MNKQIIKPSRRVHVPCFYFSYKQREDCGSGYMFPCDAVGNLYMNELGPEALESLEFCRKTDTLIEEGVVDCSYDYTECAILKCACNREVTLDIYTNTCDCGREYNLFGQELAPRSQWEDEY